MSREANESNVPLNGREVRRKLGRAPSRPRVNAKNPDLRVLTLKTWEAIEKVNDPPELFKRQNAIVHIAPASASESVGCLPVGADLLRWWLTDRLDFFENKNHTEISALPPSHLLANLLVTPNLPLPHLIGIVRHPIFAEDGTLHVEPGYSAQTQRYFAPDSTLTLRSVSLRPNSSEIEEAKKMLLKELLGDFPFVDDSSVAHALAALLLPFLRPLIHGPTPLHLIWKPKAGTGATLFAQVLCIPSCGAPSTISVAQQEEERRRTILAALLGGPGAVLLDNVSSLQGAALASCLTQVTFEDRQIGSSKLLVVPNVCLWLATANNPTLSDEIARRTVPIHLDAKVEFPDLRNDFKHPLPEWALEQKASLVWSALTLCQAWIAEGMPEGKKTLGKYESWASVLGGILQQIGVPGFLEGIETFRGKTDSESDVVRGFVVAWAEQFKDREVRVAELLPLATSLDLGNVNDRSRAIRLGKLLSERQGQQLGPWRIEKRGLASGNQQWRLQSRDESSGRGGCGGDTLPPPIEFQPATTLGVSTISTTSTNTERPQ